jgi:hypothetical protein
MLLSSHDRFFISHRSARFDYGLDACFGQHVDAIPKRKERVAGCDGTQRSIPGPENGTLRRSNSALVAGADSDGRPVSGDDNSI